MRFLVFDGEVINVGSIQEINFEEPAYSQDTATEEATPEDAAPTAGRRRGRKPFAGPQDVPAVTNRPQDRARILVLGRSEPLETSDPQRIARLRELWRAKRAVRA